MAKTLTASLVPFFDRLAGGDPASFDGRLLDGAGLQQSLERDLQRLFNVRNAMTVQEFLTGDPTVLDYGLPDTLTLSAQSDQDLLAWSRVIERGIALYEPRLAHVRVTVRPDPARPTAARAAIVAAVRLGEQLCRVDFEVALDARVAMMKVAA
ncbi:type VI secretion system baseplate subunit TssE [uncultured Massilia sp.]|uniref:type VI secretion system baseplate subunit TssE n=1 Tax=uncultured Massilia sp. TaxID=169973 RepID=UPI0025F44127|nr:type VI secretion system baseplate subunit TssE [uncultured Massilia sp.]